MVKVAIIDENEQTKLELKNFIDAQRELKCAWVSNSVLEALTMLPRNGVLHVLLISLADDNLSKLSPTQLRKVKETNPEIEIIILANSPDTKKVITLLRAGVIGYLPRHTPLAQLKEAILGSRQGGAYIVPVMVRRMLDFFRSQEDFEDVLTDREKEIVQCLVEGMSYKLIAFKLDVALDTVRYHLRNIYKKLNVHSKAQVISKVVTGELGVKNEKL
ncbi:response regulator transcription factor [Adhaeribacter rhizoryzae]|uniref:Response regulator transcription factor n=1 Tax=Adhaeribacter rhizoryzae TaxID=2607907 RepID=A0A5M6DG07_9BACT|nr:response regulator transcription factor [Adhaeribacter rhizoryzae]KAA5544145.1 response regulator transcription factor [Adhaeribacter rhizoryzae]